MVHKSWAVNSVVREDVEKEHPIASFYQLG
jgi:hypothetical protein